MDHYRLNHYDDPADDYAVYNLQGVANSPHRHKQQEGTLSSLYQSALHDEEFLLRAALTHDWDTVTNFCQFLCDIFAKSFRHEAREQKQMQPRPQPNKRLLSAAKHQLLAKDQWGNTALHSACYNSPPLNVIHALLQAASEATPKPLQIHTLVSRDQSTPLLIACATGSSQKVIATLLNPPFPGLIKAGFLVHVADQQGNTPLSELATHYDLQRKSPRHSASGGARAAPPLELVQLVSTSSEKGQQPADQQPHHLVKNFQTKLECLLQAAWADAFEDHKMSSLVHGLAHCATTSPPVVTDLILRSFPHHVHRKGPHGRLPLHLCLNRRKVVNSKQNSQQVQTEVARHAHCVQQMLAIDPAAAMIMVPHSHRRSPFLHAIVQGYHWHTAPGTQADASRNQSKTATTNPPKGVLQLLWQAAPDCLEHKDPVTGQLPFVLAATTYANHFYGTQTQPQKQQQEARILQIDTLYNLLRLHPQILAQVL